MGLTAFNRARRLAEEKERVAEVVPFEPVEPPNYDKWLYVDLKDEAQRLGVDRYYKKNKQQLIDALRGI